MPIRMLLVDDEEGILTTLSSYFRAVGFEVDAASDIEEAKRHVDSTTHDVVIVDLRLTEIDGAEGLEIIRHVKSTTEETKVILLTAFGTAAVEEEAWRLGVDAILLKPLRLDKVAEVVRDLMVASESRPLNGDTAIGV